MLFRVVGREVFPHQHLLEQESLLFTAKSAKWSCFLGTAISYHCFAKKDVCLLQAEVWQNLVFQSAWLSCWVKIICSVGVSFASSEHCAQDRFAVEILQTILVRINVGRRSFPF